MGGHVNNIIWVLWCCATIKICGDGSIASVQLPEECFLPRVAKGENADLPEKNTEDGQDEAAYGGEGEGVSMWGIQSTTQNVQEAKSWVGGSRSVTHKPEEENSWSYLVDCPNSAFSNSHLVQFQPTLSFMFSTFLTLVRSLGVNNTHRMWGTSLVALSNKEIWNLDNSTQLYGQNSATQQAEVILTMLPDYPHQHLSTM